MKSSLPATTSLRLNIAGIGFQIDCADQALLAQIARHYAGFMHSTQSSGELSKAASLSASIRVADRTGRLNDLSGSVSFWERGVRFGGREVEGYIDEDHGQAELSFSSQHTFEIADYFLRVALAVMAFRDGGLLVHAAGIVRYAKAYLFLGHSGSGKTTVARLSSGNLVLNDDLVVLMPAGGSWQAHSTPFWNPSQVRSAPGQAGLAGFLHLVQDQRIFLDSMPASQATAELIANIPVIAANPARSLQLLDRVQSLVRDYPSYHLHFLPDASFWQAIEAAGFHPGKFQQP